MPTGQITSSISVGGIEFGSSISKTATGQESHSVTLPAGIAGNKSATALTVDGLVTGWSATYGLISGDIFDMHWTDPSTGALKCRRTLVVNVASANSFTYTEVNVLGDAAPATGTALVVSEQIIVDSDWDFDLVEMFATKATVKAVADFWDTTPASEFALILPADQAYSWVNGGGFTAPSTGNPIDKIKISNGTVTAGTFSVGILYRSV